MARTVIGGCLSHSPLLNYPTAPEDQPAIRRYGRAVTRLGAAVRDNGVEILVIFGQDHFHSFFYDNMPAFCLGLGRVEAWGDWGTCTGPLAVEPDLARHIARQLFAKGFEPAVSYDLGVDHGITQPLKLLGMEDATIVPILINTSAPPLPTLARCYEFGTAVAEAIATWQPNRRVAVIGSGGLSHKASRVNVESQKSADFAAVARAIHGRASVAIDSVEREMSIVTECRQLIGGIRPDWDRALLDGFARGEAAAFAYRLDGDIIEASSGNGGQEIRTWFATAGALRNPAFEILSYEVGPWRSSGMGVVCAEPATAARVQGRQ
jgi:2,3-dihydroxyphenylpropionate 1,2-dioxygenase